MQNQEILIAQYLTNETKLYQDWYASINPQANDPDTVQFSLGESVEELKKRFQIWWQHSVEKDTARLKLLKELLCEKWRNLRHTEQVHVLIAIVLDALAMVHLPHTPPVATILVTSGYLTKLCEECENE
ncbi:MAG: hypothetical protein BWK78_02725 [Thiotrichaceae bacterium IS1]|nr:MAG: hypothetical protein BWK78_02725 [Thiotrichaceae bacterium IS1]